MLNFLRFGQAFHRNSFLR